MPLFGSRSRSGRDTYTAIGLHDNDNDDEPKPAETWQTYRSGAHDLSMPALSSASSSPNPQASAAAHGADDMHAELFTLRRSLRRTNLLLKLIIGLLLVSIVALLSVNMPVSIKKVLAQATCTTSATAPLLKTPVPDLGREKVVFDKHPIYSQRPNNVSDPAWNKLLPPGRGFVYIPEWKQYDLPPGQETDYGMIYSTAVFHQLHCLGQVRRFSWMFLDAIANNDTRAQQDIVDMFVTMDHVEHMNHCFDYLRQTIQCAGDMAMEWPRTEPDGRRFAVDGWGIPHECKNWNVIEKYMDKMHFDHSTNEEIAPLAGTSG